MDKPEILIYFSDQHNANIAGYAGDAVVRTPNLDRLAREGTVFDAAYTSYPLCVPARMSMLTGQLASRNGVLTNQHCIPGDQATLAHSLAIEGYETVLCGRMHFMGFDQRHGFMRRTVGDFTPLHPGLVIKSEPRMGVYNGTLAWPGSMRVAGGGNSPVLEYDRAVIRSALELLAEDREPPRCLVVGTYGPHHTYVAPPELYQYYKPRVPMPHSLSHPDNYRHPAMESHYQGPDEELLRRVRAAYYGMIEAMDAQVGQVFAAWQENLRRRGRQGLFIYVSDHGDQAGEHDLWAKQTFFEGSARIPLIFHGTGIRAGCRVRQPVSLMDLAPTLIELTAARPLPEPDGRSLTPALRGEEDPARAVICEYYDPDAKGPATPGRMIRRGPWKLMHYAGMEAHDLLFNIVDDPCESRNVIAEHRSLADELRAELRRGWDTDALARRYDSKLAHKKLLFSWGRKTLPDEPELWMPPDCARVPPVVE